MTRVRSHYKSYSLEEGLSEWIDPLVEKRVLGLKSLAEFQAAAIREKIEKYVELGIHPWSRFKISAADKPKADLTHHAVQLAVLLVAFIAIGGYAHAQTTWLDQALQPLADWSLAQAYSRYGVFIDFTLYLALFVSVAHVTIGRMLNHRGIAVSLGAVLAVALALAGPTWGFTIRSLAPFAALVFTALVALSTYAAARSVLPDRFSAVAASAIMLVLAVLAYAPAHYSMQWAWVGLLAPVFLVGLITRLAHHAHPTTTVPSFSDLGALPPEMGEYLPRVGEEKRIVKTYLRRITRQSVKDSEQIMGELAYIGQLLGRFSRPEIQAVIARKLDDVLPKQHRLRLQLEDLKGNLAGLATFEKRIVGNLASRYAALPHEARKELNRAMEKELAEQGILGRMQEIEAGVIAHEVALENDLTQAASAIRAGAAARASALLERSIKREQQAKDLLVQMERLSGQLFEAADRALSGFETSETAA